MPGKITIPAPEGLDICQALENALASALPEDFDFTAAVDKALKEVLSPVGRLEMLKIKPSLTGKEVEELYGIPESSLRTWRSRSGGPRYYQPYKKGAVLYEHEDIKEFMRKNSI